MRIEKNQNIQNKKAITQKKTEKQITEKKETLNIKSSLNCSANYNVAFLGLRKKEEPKEDYSIDATEVTSTIQMQPFDDYKITDDTKIALDTFIVDFASDEVKNLINNLKPNENLVLGRNATRLAGMPQSVSRQHLLVMKNHKGEVLARDMNSSFGSKILPNVETPNIKNGRFSLKPNKKYELPDNSILALGDTKVNLFEIKQHLDSMEKGAKITLGRTNRATISVPNNTVSAVHLEISKGQNGLLIKDLDSKNGTRFLGTSHIPTNIPYGCDLYNEKEIVTLSKNVPTLLPKNSQINIGGTYTIDTRNKNILELLNKKGAITIGRSSHCDVVVNNFHGEVSREHLRLQKSGDYIIATDLNPTNPSRVIPQNRIKAFYCGVKNIKLAQSNIGDCFFLSTVYSLSQTPKGQEILERMVRVDNDGNYFVHFYNTPPIKVTLEELDGQKDKKGKEADKISVSGELGAKALERAYGKLIKEPDIFSGEQTLYLEIDDGGFMDKALEDMTGIRSKVYRTSPMDTNNAFLSLLHNGFENNVVTCSTPKLRNGKNYVDSGNRFLENHAYSIKGVDYRNKLVEIVNPHNTKKVEVISWSEFNQIFDFICIAQL